MGQDGVAWTYAGTICLLRRIGSGSGIPYKEGLTDVEAERADRDCPVPAVEWGHPGCPETPNTYMNALAQVCGPSD